MMNVFSLIDYREKSGEQIVFLIYVVFSYLPVKLSSYLPVKLFSSLSVSLYLTSSVPISLLWDFHFALPLWVWRLLYRYFCFMTSLYLYFCVYGFVYIRLSVYDFLCTCFSQLWHHIYLHLCLWIPFYLFLCSIKSSLFISVHEFLFTHGSLSDFLLTSLL